MRSLKTVEKETVPACQHCGTAIKYVCWIENDETGEIIAVGRDCCGNFMRRVPTREIEVQIGRIKSVEKAAAVIAKFSAEPQRKSRIGFTARLTAT